MLKRCFIRNSSVNGFDLFLNALKIGSAETSLSIGLS